VRTRIQHPAARPGFTLMELMVVVAILGVLITLIAGGAASVISSHRQSASEQLVKKVALLLERHWRAAIDDADKQPLIGSIQGVAGGDNNRARVIQKILRLRSEFPVSFGEVTTSAEFFATPYPELNGAAGAGSDWESSICLLAALTTRTRSGVKTDADTTLASNEIATAPSGQKAIVDTWGRPLRFYRFPTGNDDLNPGGVAWSNPKRNPLDRDGLLASQNWWDLTTNAGPATFNGWGLFTVTQNQSYNLVPLVASAGRDGRIGLAPGSMAVVNADEAYDNIVSNRVTAK